MRIRSFIPVQVSFDVDHVTHIQGFNRFVDFRLRVGQIELNAELNRFSILGSLEIDVVLSDFVVLVLDLPLPRYRGRLRRIQM